LFIGVVTTHDSPIVDYAFADYAVFMDECGAVCIR
jgi:hypothetical protein